VPPPAAFAFGERVKQKLDEERRKKEQEKANKKTEKEKEKEAEKERGGQQSQKQGKRKDQDDVPQGEKRRKAEISWQTALTRSSEMSGFAGYSIPSQESCTMALAFAYDGQLKVIPKVLQSMPYTFEAFAAKEGLDFAHKEAIERTRKVILRMELHRCIQEELNFAEPPSHSTTGWLEMLLGLFGNQVKFFSNFPPLLARLSFLFPLGVHCYHTAIEAVTVHLCPKEVG